MSPVLNLAAENYAMRTYLDKKPAVALAIQESSGANALEIASRVSSTMEELKKQFPEGLDYQIVYNPTKSVRAGIEAVLHTLFEAILLVVLVVFLFLQTWRASIIPLLAVPVLDNRHDGISVHLWFFNQCPDPFWPRPGYWHCR